ncbi:MAG: hypothetical protein ACT4OX_16100 [Actinomycetota bacterium]
MKATSTTVASEPEWTLIEVDAFADGYVSDVAADADVIVAVGRDARDTEADPVVWISNDGSDWSTVALALPDASRVWDAPVVGAGRDGFVALAQFNALDRAPIGSEAGQVAWVSPDGRSWELVDADDAGLATATEVQEVEYVLRDARAADVVYTDRWIGGGDGGWDRSYETASAGLVAWTSPDGRSWRVHSGRGEPFGGEIRSALAVGSDGTRVVVAGHSSGGPLPGYRDATLWWSDDGEVWNRVGDGGALSGSGNEEIHAVARGGRGWVAVGFDENGDPAIVDTRGAVWFSPDGTTWERIPHDEALFGGPGEVVEIRALVATDQGYVAAGNWRGDHAPSAAVWTSRDGRAWQLADVNGDLADSDAHIEHLVAFGSGLLAVDTEYSVRLWSLDL